MPFGFGGAGVQPSSRGLLTNTVSLKPGSVWNFPVNSLNLNTQGGSSPVQSAGQFAVMPGKYTSLQVFDPILQAWRVPGGGPAYDADMPFVWEDGVNWRLANLTGCVVGALLTTAGSGYTSAPLVTATGGSQWRAIVGGAVATAVTVSNGGSGYTYPPIVAISAPPPGGIQATATAALAGGAVTSVTMVDQGAGYTSPPTITFLNDYRETLNASGNITAGSGAQAVCTLTGAQTVTGLICIDHGGPVTSVPNLVFSGGGGSSAAATAIMCWSITAFSPSAGTGFTGPSLLSGLDAFPTTNPAYTNPTTQANLVRTRPASILMPESGGAPTATNAVFYDGGIYTSVPTPLVTTNGALITQTTTVTFTMGGYTDVSLTLII